MTEVIPAIIPKNYFDLEEKLSFIQSFTRMVQIDITDGKLVPTKSWPYWQGGYDDYFQAILKEDQGMPMWEKIDFEFHLMVKEPKEMLENCVKAGAKRIIVHLCALDNPDEFFAWVEKEYGNQRRGLVGFGLGLAIESETKLEEFSKYIDLDNEYGEKVIDYVQVMGIKNVGFQGQDMDEKVYETISAIRAKYPELPISVDGGVTLENAGDLVDAGATRLVSGSAIFDSNNPKEAIDYLKSL